MNKLEDFNQIWQDVNEAFNSARNYRELDGISYLLEDFRDYMTDVIDELEADEEIG